MTTIKMTDHQKKTLARVCRNAAKGDDSTCLSPVIASQLIRKGLVRRNGTYQRREWNTVVATLYTVTPTAAGIEADAVAK